MLQINYSYPTQPLFYITVINYPNLKPELDTGTFGAQSIHYFVSTLYVSMASTEWI